MPGSNLNLALPTLADNMATVVSKTATALSTIQTDLAGKITPSQMSINSVLSMAGNALTNVGSLQLADGNAPTAAGSIYYQAGEFYGVDAAGIVQITSNGSLNVAGQVGIVGDYGGTNPARVTYIDSSGQYQFTEDTSIFADLVCDDLILEGTLGSVTLGVDASLSGGKTLSFKSLNGANTALLCYKASSSTVEDSATNVDDKQITGNVVITSGGLTATGAVTAAGNVKGANLLHTATKAGVLSLTGGSAPINATVAISGVTSTAASWVWTSAPAIQLINSDILKSVAFTFEGISGQSYTFTMYRYTSTGFLGTIDTWTGLGAGHGVPVTVSRTFASPYTVLSNDTIFLFIQAPGGAAAGDKVYPSPVITWTHPA